MKKESTVLYKSSDDRNENCVAKWPPIIYLEFFKIRGIPGF